jgi:hypothetical protein
MPRNASLDKKLVDRSVMVPSSTPTPQNVGEGADNAATRPSQNQNVVLGRRPEYAAFANALRAAMLKQGLSASEVARRVWGTTKDSRGYDVARNRDRIGHYLNETSYPEPENLIKLAEVLELDVQDLAVDKPVFVAGAGTSYRGRQPGDIQMTVLADQPNKARLVFDRVLDFETAMRLLQMIKEDERKALQTAMPPTGRSFGKPEPELRGPASNPSVTAPTAA